MNRIRPPSPNLSKHFAVPSLHWLQKPEIAVPGIEAEANYYRLSSKQLGLGEGVAPTPRLPLRSV